MQHLAALWRNIGDPSLKLSFLAVLIKFSLVFRLEWQKGIAEEVRSFCALIDSSSSFRAYRQALAETNPPCIPYM